jgi:single-strand DNA-binding protein
MGAESEPQNFVRLRGELQADVSERTLASGEVVSTFRVIVGRSAAQPRKRSADTIDCVTSQARVRRTLERLKPGSSIEVEGSLQRRFFRSGGAVVSRYEVNVDSLSRRRA